MKLEPIINSLLDTDLYKFNMNQVIFHKHTDLVGEYFFKCRNKNIIFTKEMLDEINEQIDHLCTLSFTNEELNYLRSIRFIKEDYIQFLRLYHPIRDYVSTSLTPKGELIVDIKGPLFSAMQFEIYLLEIINETYFRLKYNYDELVESAISFDEIMNVPTYEEVEKILYGQEDDEDEDSDEDETPKKSSKKVADEDDEPAPAKKSKHRDEEDEDDEPPKKSSKKSFDDMEDVEDEPPKKAGKCPFGHKFGSDVDGFDDCDNCDCWDKCTKVYRENR